MRRKATCRRASQVHTETWRLVRGGQPLSRFERSHALLQEKEMAVRIAKTFWSPTSGGAFSKPVRGHLWAFLERDRFLDAAENGVLLLGNACRFRFAGSAATWRPTAITLAKCAARTWSLYLAFYLDGNKFEGCAKFIY